MHKKWLVLAGIFLFLIPSVIAVQPEEKSTKIFGSPFYRATMTNNNEYNWTIPVKPPDGITSVLSAIVAFDVYLTPSVNFTIKVNGIPCNTYFYYVSTTYASAGQSRVTFDCSNRITKAGTYNVTIRPTGANTGSVSGWLDLTYMNNPNPSISISGTEYNIGEAGTVFLQLLNGTNQPVNNALCYLKAYYPNKTIFINNSQMTYYVGSDGLYYYDLTIPNDTGVYMLSANCNFYNNLTYSPAQQDTFVNSAANTTNYGNLSYLYIGRGGVSTFYYGYVQFNTSNIMAGGIRSVEIYLYQNLGLVNTPVVTAQRVTSTWNESTATWNTKPTNDAYVYDRQMISQGWYKWNITSLMFGWLNGSYTNYGVFFNISPSAGTLNYTSPASKESGGGYQPYLLIQYQTNEQINEIRGSGELHVSDTLLTAINSVNATANQTLSYVVALNGSVFNLSQAELSHFQQLLAILQDINYTLNTTLEYKLDLINGTVFQINQSQTAYYLSLFGAIESVGATLNGTIIPYLVDISGNLTEITQYLVVINDTTYQINQSQYQNYLSIIQAINANNDTQTWQYLNLLSLLNDINATGNATLTLMASINQSLLTYYTNLYNSLISLNTTQNQHFADIMNFLASLNYTMNTTLELKLDLINDTVFNIQDTVNQINYTVSNLNFTINFSEVLAAISQVNTTANQNQQYLIAINNTLWNDIYVILKDINFTTNTTLEYKLDLINYTTWQSWVMLQNLTIGNVSVTANVNWTEGLPYIWNASNTWQVDYQLLSMAGEGINLVTETYLCLDNFTLQSTMNVTNCIQGTCNTYERTATQLCSWGCGNNQCLPQPQFQYMYAIAFALVVIGLMIAVWRGTRKGGI